MCLPPSARRTFWSHFTWWNNRHQYKTVFNLPANIKRTKNGREFFMNGCLKVSITFIHQLIELITGGAYVRREQMWFLFILIQNYLCIFLYFCNIKKLKTHPSAKFISWMLFSKWFYAGILFSWYYDSRLHCEYYFTFEYNTLQ